MYNNMVPEFNSNLLDIEDDIPNLTYKLNNLNHTIVGIVDDLDAIKQSVYKILCTERGSNPIYDPDYGVELERFFGKDNDFIKSDIERTITEALTYDDRILNIYNFKIIDNNKNSLIISFSVNTLFGDIDFEREVIEFDR